MFLYSMKNLYISPSLTSLTQRTVAAFEVDDWLLVVASIIWTASDLLELQ